MRAGVPRIFAPGFLDGPMMLNNGPPPPGAFAVADPAQARYAVHVLAESGVDFLKVYNSIPRDAYFALAEEARALGIPFAGHVPEAVSTGEASDAGQLSEEHLINILLDCSTKADELRAARIATMTSDKITGEARLRALAWPDPEGLFDTYSEEKAARLFAKFVENGTWHTPTLVVLAGFARARDDEFAHDPRRRFLPKQWTDSWDPRVTFYLRDLSPEDYEALHLHIVALLVRYKKLVGDMRKAGVEFLAGTDSSGWNPVLPGFGLHEELALLVESGLTPLEALQSATRNPARYFNKLGEMGTVEVKKAADLVLLRANPLEDIHNTQQIEAVILHGRFYSRKELNAMVKPLQ
jgi:imidazolonepropionase-like amidohydrolase